MELWARLSGNVRRAILLAHSDVVASGALQIDTEHLLGGLVRLGTGGALGLLHKLGVDTDALNSAARQMEPPRASAERSEMKFTQDAERALQLAYFESVELGQERVGTAHVLLGLLMIDRGNANKLLEQAGVHIEAVRAAVGGAPATSERFNIATAPSRDVASEPDSRGIMIDRVGVRELHLPVRVREKAGGFARVLGCFDASVQLPHHYRGTHMSRFGEILQSWSKQPVSTFEIEEMLRQMQQTFDANAARVSLSFKYFMTKHAPATGVACELDYDCSFTGEMVGDDYVFTLGAKVPIITLCPCSKEISDRGAHSQRANLNVQLRTTKGVMVWLEDLIQLLEAQGSYELFPILKRADEKIVTERSYDNPKFVEDVVRDSVLALNSLHGVTWYSVECESFESIHNHIAYAYAESE